jgi:VanZ family protein
VAVCALMVTLLVLLTPAPTLNAVSQWLRNWLVLVPAVQQIDAYRWDWLAHAALFAVCGWSLMRGWYGTRRAPLVFFGALIAYGLVTEWLQQYVPGRGADPTDLVADALGALAGIHVGWWQHSRVSG